MSVSFATNTKGKSVERAFDEGDHVKYNSETVEIVNKQEFRDGRGVYYLYRIKKPNGSVEPPNKTALHESNGIPSTKFTKIETNFGRTGSGESTDSTGSNNSEHNYYSKTPWGGAMSKNRKSKNRKSKNRKTKRNSKTKNHRKTKRNSKTKNHRKN
jgi:hypothetical protein